MSRTRRAAGALLCTVLAALAPAAPATADPRPLSDAERQAVELAALYLDQGPAAWWPRLAEASPLRALGRAAALEEIGVRAGPREGASWRLETPGPEVPEQVAILAIELPSGADEVLELTFDAAGGLLAVTSLVEARELPPVEIAPPATVSAATDPGTGAPAAGSAARARDAAVRLPKEVEIGPTRELLSVPGSFGLFVRQWGIILAACALGVALLLWVIARGTFGGRAGKARLASPETFQRRPPPPPPVSAVLLAAALAAGAVVACRAGDGGSSGPPAGSGVAGSASAPVVPVVPPPVRLGALRPIRDALGRGEPLPSPPPGLDGAAARAERLWYAERLLLEMDLDGAAAVLDGFPVPSEVPLVERLRARLALVRGERLEAPAAYERALRLGPDHDGLRFEMADVLFQHGFQTEAEAAIEELVASGSRIAGVYYTAAVLVAASDRIEEAERLLRTAWLLEPIERAELFDSPAFAFLATRPSLFEVIGLGSPVEPTVEPPFEGRRPIALPGGARPALTGRLLRVAVGPGWLEVSGGWVLAPAITPVEDALTARRGEVEALLAAAPDRAGGRGLLVHPGHLRQLLRTAFALARERRWNELEALTAPLGDDVARLPPDLVRLRAVALLRLDRDGEATRLMIGLARAQALGQRRDAGSLYELGELFAAGGEHDLAMRLIRKAGELSPYPLGDLRLRQIALDKELAESYRTLRSEHFELRYPASSGADHAEQVAWVLEEELRRLQRWIPGKPRETIEVSLFPLADFVSAFSGGIDVIGLYDGRVRVPFAHLRSLHPYLVATLSHELAHAMIDQRTDGRAPDWVQEGLAQHVEMGQGAINPIPDLAARRRVLALPMVDAALDGFSEPELVELAYAQAAWTMHFVEVRHGVAGIHRLLDAFAAGADGDEAVRRAFGTDLAGFDRAQREWCLEQAPPTWPTQVRRYDKELESPLARGGAAAAPAGGENELPARWTRRTPGAMEEWHSRYKRRVAAFRRALGPAVERVRAGGNARAACAGLETETAALLADPAALASPDPAPGRALQTAVEGFGRMAVACGAGDLDRARRELTAAERQLGRVAELLQAYGLAP